MFKKSLLIFVFCFSLPSVTNAQDVSLPAETKQEQKLHYSVSLGLGYQSFTYFVDQNRAMESFLTLNLLTAYYPLSFLALSYHLGLGVLSFYNTDTLSNQHLVYFPDEVSRINVENTLSLEFFGFINSDSLMYFATGGSYIYMGNMSQKSSTNTSGFPKSQQHQIYFKTSLGSRFALYNHTLMDVQLYLMIPFKKIRSWVNEGQKIYKQLAFGFEISIGYFD